MTQDSNFPSSDTYTHGPGVSLGNGAANGTSHGSGEYSLPVVSGYSGEGASKVKYWWSGYLQWLRIGLLIVLIAGMHLYYQKSAALQRIERFSRESVLPILEHFPQGSVLAESIDADEFGKGRWWVFDRVGATIGYVVQTAPDSDSFLGFSGPTNLLLAFDDADRLIRIEVQSSYDTKEHVDLVRAESEFWGQWLGKSPLEISTTPPVHSVAGATLTSRAIAQSVHSRLGSDLPLGQFSEPIALERVQALFPASIQIERNREVPSLWHVMDAERREIGWVLRTSPASDHIVGYQGPTDTIIGIRLDGEILGINIGASFDNEPYVGYVKKDRWFQNLWKKQRWPEIAKMDLVEAGVEGVSGATMTSQAVAESLVQTAHKVNEALKTQNEASDTSVEQWGRWKAAFRESWGSLLFVGVVTILALGKFGKSKSSSFRSYRLMILTASFLYLGLVQGHLLSLAMWGGWVQHGLSLSGSLVFAVITVIAISCAAFYNRNVYCSHLCAYGALQQLLPRKYAWRSPNSRNWKVFLSWVRPALFVWAWCILMFGLPKYLPFAFQHSVAHLEPFDAFVWEVVSIPGIAIAAIGVLLSLKIPMGYCQYGCLTGSLLNYVRPVRYRDRFGKADAFLSLLIVLTYSVLFWN